MGSYLLSFYFWRDVKRAGDLLWVLGGADGPLWPAYKLAFEIVKSCPQVGHTIGFRLAIIFLGPLSPLPPSIQSTQESFV